MPPEPRTRFDDSGSRSWTLTVSLVLLVIAFACDDEPSRRDILGTEENLYSMIGEELVIRDFFQDRRGGFFLDVGSAWPKKDNNTYYLEAHLGWSGIAIDALDLYRPAWERDRKRSRLFTYLVSDEPSLREPFYRTGATGLSSATKDRDFLGQKLEAVEIEVETMTLDLLLDREGIEKVDFVSMDIEGHELLALAAFDIQRFEPELLCVEVGADLERQAALLAYFEGRGYELLERYREFDYANMYFAPKSR